MLVPSAAHASADAGADAVGEVAASYAARTCSVPARPTFAAMPFAESPSALERMRQSQQGEAAATLAPAGGGVPILADCESDVDAAATFPEVDEDTELGTMAIPVDRTRFDDRWDRVRRAPPAALMRNELRSAGVTPGIGEAEVLQRVNQWVNRRIAYVNDDQNYREGDFWATAEQTIARGRGDCEDYAILKMQMLLAAGIDADRVKLVLLRDLAVNADHAFLLVQSKHGKLVLDNMTDRLYDGSRSNDVRPILSFSGARRWVHGYRDAQPVLAVAAASSVQKTPIPVITNTRQASVAPLSVRVGASLPAEPSFRSIRLSLVDYLPGPVGRIRAL